MILLKYSIRCVSEILSDTGHEEGGGVSGRSCRSERGRIGAVTADTM